VRKTGKYVFTCNRKSKLSDANYWATKPKLWNPSYEQRGVTQHKAGSGMLKQKESPEVGRGWATYSRGAALMVNVERKAQNR